MHNRIGELALGAATTLVAFAPLDRAKAQAGTVRVEGRVIDVLGDPVPRASIIATTRGGGFQVAKEEADGSGAFLFARLPRRELVLRAAAPGRIGSGRRLDLEDEPYAGLTELPVVLRLMDAVTVRGQVRDSNGQPIPTARVTSEPADRWMSHDTPTTWVEADTNGRFELPLTFGHSRICAFAPHHEVAAKEATVSEDCTIDFALPGTQSCELRIRYRGATAADLDWMAFCDTADFSPDLWQLWPQTRRDETVTFHGLPVGSSLKGFRLFFVPARIENTDYAVPTESGTHEIEAPTGPWVRQDDPRVELRGRLVDGAGTPIAGARLTWWVSPERDEVALTDDDGRFHLPIRTTQESVWIGLENQPYVPVSPRRERHPGDYAFNNFDVPTSGTNDLILVAEKAARITGRLFDNEKRPIWGAHVQIWAGERKHERPSDRSVATLTNREGRFAIDGLRASSRFLAWLRATSEHFEFATEPLTLRSGEVLALGDIVVPKPNTIEGIIPEAHKGQRAGVRVTVRRDKSGRAYDSSHETFTDRHGRFRFRGLPDGHYSVHVGEWPGRWVVWPTLDEVTVIGGQRVEIEPR